MKQLSFDLVLNRTSSVVEPWVARRVLGLYGATTPPMVHAAFQRHASTLNTRAADYAYWTRYLTACKEALLSDKPVGY